MRKFLLMYLFFSVSMLYSQELTWQVQFLKGGMREPLPESQSITVENGQDFRLSITPASDCFCYVLYQGSDRKFSVLNSQAAKGDDEINFPLPAEKLTGKATLFVIMSLTKQTSLESYIAQYKKNSNSRRPANKLHEEIAKLQEEVSDIGRTIIDIIPSGGTTRSHTEMKEEDPLYTTMFSGNKIYVRAITIIPKQAAR